MDKLDKRRSRIVRWFLRAAAVGMLVLFLGWLFVAIQIQLNHIPDSMKQPPAVFAAFERQPTSPEAAASRGAAAHPRWNNPDPPESFGDYVRFRLEGDPGDEGAKLYLELGVPYAKEKYYEQWNRLFAPETGPAWQPGVALNEAQRQWLETHGDWIGKLRRMIAAGGPPMPGAGERSKDDIVKRLKFPTPDIQLLQTAGKILVAESERLREANDQAAAADLLLASYSLAAETINQQMIGQLVSTSVRKWTDQAIAARFASDPPGGSSLNRLRDGLDASRDGDRGRRSRIAAEELADMRMAGIYQFDQPIVYWAGWNAFL